MPVSPRDFELYSRMTGTSMPTDAISRARMAPEVYSFTRNFAKSPNILDKAGEMVKGIGRTFQRGIGAGIQADLSGAKSPYTNTSQGSRFEFRGKDTQSGEGEPKPVGKTPDGQLLYDAADLKDPHRPTSGNYGQGVTENQTTESLMERKGVQGGALGRLGPALALRNDARATTAAHPWGLFNPLALAARRRRTLRRGDDALGHCC